MKKKKSKVKTDEIIEKEKKRNPKIEFLSKVDDLIRLEEEYLVREEYDKAIQTAEKIIRFSIKNEVDHLILEQEKFMKKIATYVQNKYYTTEINEAARNIEKIYDILIDINDYPQAHEILEAFKNNYSNKIDIDSIPIIKKLNQKDIKAKIKNQLN